MRINPSITDKNQFTQTFKARLKITPSDELKYSKDLLTKYIQKAKKIGLENDVIEIKYGAIRSDANEYSSPQDNVYFHFGEKYKRRVTVSANINGKQQYKAAHRLSMADHFDELQKMEDHAVNESLDELYQKFPNDKWQ